MARLYTGFRPTFFRSSLNLDFKGAELKDFAEIENLEKGGPIAIADYTIVNDGSIEEMYSDLDKFLIDFNSDAD